jgi:hypothetical protein
MSPGSLDTFDVRLSRFSFYISITLYACERIVYSAPLLKIDHASGYSVAPLLKRNL